MDTIKQALETRGLLRQIVLTAPIDTLLASLQCAAGVPPGSDVSGSVTFAVAQNLGFLALNLTPPAMPVRFRLISDPAAGTFSFWLVLSSVAPAKKIFSFASGAAGVVFTAATHEISATRIATITIEAEGLDLVELQASEPGLFADPPDPTARPPEFRLKRASGVVNDPVYAREIARGPLVVTRVGANIRFSAEIDDPSPLGEFIRYSYWAEVRMPPERRLAHGILEIPPAGGVGPIIAEQLADIARPFSAVSAPASALPVPPLPVPLPEDAAASVTAAGGTLTASLTATATPSASPKAINPYRLRIWEQWGDAAIGPVSEIDLDGAPLAWTGTPVSEVDHARPLHLRFVIVDPIGRESPMQSRDAS